MRLFVAGATYTEIARVVGLRSSTSVANIVQREFSAPEQRRELLTDEAMAMWQERWERLWRAHWPRALDGDYRSAELCRKLLAQFALVYGLGQQVPVVGTKLDAVEVDQDDDGDGMDVLSRLRADRARAEVARASG